MEAWGSTNNQFKCLENETTNWAILYIVGPSVP